MSFRMAQVANIQPSVSQCDVKIQFEPLLKKETYFARYVVKRGAIC